MINCASVSKIDHLVVRHLFVALHNSAKLTGVCYAKLSERQWAVLCLHVGCGLKQRLRSNGRATEVWSLV